MICLCYILSTGALQGIPFCQVLDSEIQIFENLFLQKIILAVGCVYSGVSFIWHGALVIKWIHTTYIHTNFFSLTSTGGIYPMSLPGSSGVGILSFRSAVQGLVLPKYKLWLFWLDANTRRSVT